ncbi:hypothetical protein Wcon_01941 [Wolbachia endosymbiont of Cylisticus convexus]|nr:hypothetical protein Wcon_01941 [Wolbachia endosymbiont of Cylisticus convexus]
MDEIAAFAEKFDEGLRVGEERGIQIGHEKGKAEGEKQAKIAVAKNLLKAGISTDIISQTTGLSFNEIKQLQSEKTS